MAETAQPSLGRGARIDSIDLMRSLVVVVMALDHVRDSFNLSTYSATDLGKASLALFLTRFVTHFCAPTFILLAGTSAALYARSRPREVAGFLFRRGLLLIALELTWIQLSWPYLYMRDYQAVFAQVLWALGASRPTYGSKISSPAPKSTKAEQRDLGPLSEIAPV